jgi:hypothetical protein
MVKYFIETNTRFHRSEGGNMPLSPEEAAESSPQSAEFALLCNEIDRQLSVHGKAAVTDPSKFGRDAIEGARRAYAQQGWDVQYQTAGQFDVPELLSIRPREQRLMSDEDVAQLFHDTYERLAPEHGYETRKASAVPWEDVPTNNKSLMIAVAGVVAKAIRRETS